MDRLSPKAGACYSRSTTSTLSDAKHHRARRRGLAAGRTTAEELVEECVARIADPDGEGVANLPPGRCGRRPEGGPRNRCACARPGREPSPYAGIPVSVKDLFDVRGQVTRAGSQVSNSKPADEDAAAVASWRRAGLVLIGRTNMTEFAFSGLGINPHHGTPANPWDRRGQRIPGRLLLRRCGLGR